MKVCPDCAEEVLEAAKVCRYCGHNFELEGVPSVGHYVAIVLLVILLVAVIYGAYLGTKAQTSGAVIF